MCERGRLRKRVTEIYNVLSVCEKEREIKKETISRVRQKEWL